MLKLGETASLPLPDRNTWRRHLNRSDSVFSTQLCTCIESFISAEGLAGVGRSFEDQGFPQDLDDPLRRLQRSGKRWYIRYLSLETTLEPAKENGMKNMFYPHAVTVFLADYIPHS
ncbi:hypothetical protein J6590_071208 [Homalodisca vitripennis]|nr:hypothetical protein J6590_071208 [Homalodisca vitripennis]